MKYLLLSILLISCASVDKTVPYRGGQFDVEIMDHSVTFVRVRPNAKTGYSKKHRKLSMQRRATILADIATKELEAYCKSKNGKVVSRGKPGFLAGIAFQKLKDDQLPTGVEIHFTCKK